MIYFIQAGENGPIKIGYSKTPELRLAKLQTGNPNPLKFLGIIKGNYKKEAEIHKKFSNLKSSNEWFFPAKSLIDFIKLYTDNHCCEKVDHQDTSQLSLWDTRQNSVVNIDNLIALYHCIFRDENFEIAARHLWRIVQYAQEQFPQKSRALFIDIEEHKNKLGGYDADMFELLNEFSIGFLMKYLTELHTPLLHIKNPTQNNDVLQPLIIRSQEVN